MAELGFSRVILARELSLKEIEDHRQRLRHRDRVLCPRGTVHEHERPVLYVGLPGRPQRQPGLLCRALPPAL